MARPSSGQCQTIIWPSAGMLLNGSLGTNFSENFKGNSNIFIWKCHLQNVVHFVLASMCFNHPWYWGWHVLGLVLLQWPLHDLLDLWHQRPRWNNLGFTTPDTGHWGCYGSLLQSLYSDDLDHATSRINSVTDLVIPGTRGLEKCGLNVWRMMSVNLACLVFDTMGRMVVVGGWVDGGWWLVVLQDLTDDQSTLAQVLGWCSLATSHCPSLCWPRSVSPLWRLWTKMS